MTVLDILRSDDTLADREHCIQAIDIELMRINRSVLDYGNKKMTNVGYNRTIGKAQRILRRSTFVRTKTLKKVWLTLLGYRLSVEDKVRIGGLRNARYNITQKLDVTINDVKYWGVNRLFEAYMFTKLSDDWNYHLTAFRCDDHEPLPYFGHRDYYDNLEVLGVRIAA
jgi:hypothetical protein